MSLPVAARLTVVLVVRASFFDIVPFIERRRASFFEASSFLKVASKMHEKVLYNFLPSSKKIEYLNPKLFFEGDFFGRGFSFSLLLENKRVLLLQSIYQY